MLLDDVHNKHTFFDLSKIEFSRNDVKKGLTLPSELTPELAEDLGIMTGDGCLNPCMANDHEILCSGDPKDELDYYANFVCPLKCKLFNISLRPRIINPKRQNEFGIRSWSKAIFSFYRQAFEFPVGNKECSIGVPNIIVESDKGTRTSFVRGLFDTDGSLTFRKKNSDVYYYPIIKFNTVSSKLFLKVKVLLKSFGFNDIWSGRRLRYDLRYNRNYLTYDIDISGKNNLNNWIKLIGFSNPKHLTKYLVWERLGFCPIKTNLQDRLAVLSGEKSFS